MLPSPLTFGKGGRRGSNRQKTIPEGFFSEKLGYLGLLRVSRVAKKAFHKKDETLRCFFFFVGTRKGENRTSLKRLFKKRRDSLKSQVAKNSKGWVGSPPPNCPAALLHLIYRR
jgi:hypothetical protein